MLIERINVYNNSNLFGCAVDGNYSNYGSDVDRIDHILMGNRVSFKRLQVYFFVSILCTVYKFEAQI